jgi:glutamine amidotransferase
VTIAVIDTGCANLASVGFALDRLNQPYLFARQPDEASHCDRVILPGVGAAGPAMIQLRKSGWATSLKNRRRPLLGICLGMHLLFERSAEGDVAGLGLLQGEVKRLMPNPQGIWPHMGWNTIEAFSPSEPLLANIEENSHAYFVHGYFVPQQEQTTATCVFGQRLSAIVRSGSIAGCQFHPELSGAVGSRLLDNFVRPQP